MSRIIVEGGLLFTGDEVLPDAVIVVEAGSVAEIAPGRPDRREGDEVIEASGCLVTPGLVNAHTHIYSSLARGIALKDPPPANFPEILERLWWRLDRALTLEEIELSAKLHGIECLRGGVTTIFDHHASQRAIRGSLATISRSLEELGLRGCLCFEVSDREGPVAAGEAIEENRRFIEEVAGSGGTMRRALFGLHAPFTLSEHTLAACVQAASGTGFHIHLAESTLDGPDAARRLDAAGVLGPRTICVHGVHLDRDGIAILARSRSWLVHCPQSNANNAVGALSLEMLRDAGVRAALGTDGFTASIVREALAAHLLQTHLTGDPSAGSATVPDLLLRGNAALASETFGLDLGRLAPGGPADLVVWDYRPPTPLTAENLWAHLLFGWVNARAETVLIDGKRVLSGGRPTACDEIELAQRCRRAAERLWERF